MIRVMFRWTIKEANAPEFENNWREGTRLIQEECEGSMGSFLIHDRRRPEQFVAIAKWASRDAFKAAQPVIIGLKLKGPMPETFEVFDEIADIAGAGEV